LINRDAGAHFPVPTDEFPAGAKTFPAQVTKKFPAPDWHEIRAVYRNALKARRE
jgi:hypothetical protein